MWSWVAAVPFLLAAGVLAGIASSSGAIGSLIAYPALLLVGLSPITANTTGAVAVIAVSVGASLRSREELASLRAVLPRTVPLAAAGGLAGAALLLVTPDDTFRWIVPFLVAAATVLLLAQPRISRRHGLRPAVLPAGLVVVTAYEGFFGAGSGVMTLALVLLSVDAQLPAANAAKNLLLGVADVLAALIFIVFGTVSWAAVLAIGTGFLAGGAVGPTIVRRAPEGVLRVVIALAGFAVAVALLVDAAT